MLTFIGQFNGPKTNCTKKISLGRGGSYVAQRVDNAHDLSRESRRQPFPAYDEPQQERSHQNNSTKVACMFTHLNAGCE